MTRFIGTVVDNLDDEYQKRIKANIIGLTESIPVENLPWAFPLEDDCVVPPIHDLESDPPVISKVWIYAEKEEESEDYDYNRLYYESFTEETYKECYDYTNSDAYALKKDNLVESVDPVEEPPPVESVEYPKNRVIKISNITIEFDAGNKRFNLIDENGNYLTFNENGVVEKSMKDKTTIVKGNLNILVEGTANFVDTNGNKVTLSSDGVKVEASVVEITGGKLKTKGTVTPDATSGGPFCAVPGGKCLFTAAPITGNEVNGT